jgi:hypothetical protein
MKAKPDKLLKGLFVITGKVYGNEPVGSENRDVCIGPPRHDVKDPHAFTPFYYDGEAKCFYTYPDVDPAKPILFTKKEAKAVLARLTETATFGGWLEKLTIEPAGAHFTRDYYFAVQDWRKLAVQWVPVSKNHTPLKHILKLKHNELKAYAKAAAKELAEFEKKWR